MRAPSRCPSPRARVTRRTTNEAPAEDLRHLRERRAGRRLQGRAHAVPVPDRAGQDPAQPAVRHVRAAPASAEHRHQAGARARAVAVHQRLRRLTSRRPAGWGQVLALAGYLLLAPPVFVFGPLAGLLLVSRPGTMREWAWLVGAAAWSAIWLQQIGGLGAQVTRAGAVLLCGTFLALTLWQPSNGVGRALAATAAAGAGLVAWMWRLGIGWSQLVTGVDHDLGAYQTALREQWRNAGAPQ